MLRRFNWAILGLLTNATVWGVSWIGFKSLHIQGIHPLWLTAIIYTVAFLAIHIYKPNLIRSTITHPYLYGVMLSAGLTNICFNTAITIGDVLRVTLLFYLMPIWTALLAYMVLGETINFWQILRLLLGLSGAYLILWQPNTASILPKHLSDYLGIIGGLCFAINNIALRKTNNLSGMSDLMRLQAMFIGSAVCSLLLAFILSLIGIISVPNIIPTYHLSLSILEILFWVILFLIASYGVQYGTVRIPANLTALIMLSEIFIAGCSSAYYGESQLRWQEWIGGSLIVFSPFLFYKKKT